MLPIIYLHLRTRFGDCCKNMSFNCNFISYIKITFNLSTICSLSPFCVSGSPFQRSLQYFLSITENYLFEIWFRFRHQRFTTSDDMCQSFLKALKNYSLQFFSPEKSISLINTTSYQKQWKDCSSLSVC